MIRCTAIRVLVFLLLGAIVNVAVAWTAGMLQNPLARPAVAMDDRESLIWAYVWRTKTSILFAWGRRTSFRDESPDFDRIPDFVPRWPGVNPLRGIDAHWRGAAAFGWPFRSMWYELEWKSIRGGVVIHSGDRDVLGWDIPYALPLRPIWPGFAINTIFYAAILWLLFAAPGLVRRRIRRFRGRCLHCGYDLRGHVPEAESIKCPECGRSAL